MAEEENKQNQNNTSDEYDTDSSLQGSQSDENVSEDVFAGDENLLNILDDAANTASEPHTTTKNNVGAQIGLLRFLTTQNILIAAMVLIIAMLACSLFKIASTQRNRPSISSHPKAIVRDSVVATDVPQDTQPISDQDTDSQYADETEQPISLSLANDYLVNEDYEMAYSVYNRLFEALPDGKAEQSIRDLLQFRMAVCLLEMGHSHQAERLFRTVSKSSSCPLRLIANYYRALIELNRNQFMEARACAYRAMVLTSAVTVDTNWALELQRNCAFIIGQAITRKMLILTNTDKDIPKELWMLPSPTDPFINLTKQQLCTFLNSGSKRFNNALMGPQIQKLESDDTVNHFSVTSFAAPLEELTARFAANAELDIHWNLQPPSKNLLNKPLALYLPDVTASEFATIVTGCAGLFAHTDTNNEKGIIKIDNPDDYTELTKHIAVLSERGIPLWQEYLIRYYDDKFVPNAHFALALLLAQRQNIPEAIEQFRMVANRFPYSRLSPYALLHTSRLKANMHDYHGAREDLKQLVQQYHDMGITPKAYLYLARATTEAGQYRQAVKTYQKVYNLDFSFESKVIAAFEAAKCLYQIKDYAAAQKWLKTYINLVEDTRPDDLRCAYLLLGRTQLALGESQNACQTFALALSEQINDKERLEIVNALAENQDQRGNLILALDVLETISINQLSQEQATDTLLLRSQILRKMGLVDKAVALISNRAGYIFKPQLQAKAYFELAQCCIETGNLQAAYAHLTTTISLAEAGTLMEKAQLELARISLKLGKDKQTLLLCSNILKRTTSDDVRQEASNLLAIVYRNQKSYNKALEILLAQSNQTNLDDSDEQAIKLESNEVNLEKQDS
ncbi:MAG: tetratricopeptide repeat protein [Phycisphaerales bacterium]|jgi:tetratricopeptide (TPR) repeat protein